MIYEKNTAILIERIFLCIKVYTFLITVTAYAVSQKAEIPHRAFPLTTFVLIQEVYTK